MESLMSGTLAGTGSFRCEDCGYVLTLEAEDKLPPCPGCSGEGFVRASLFGARFRRDGAGAESAKDLAQLMDAASGEISEAGEYLVFEDAGKPRVVALHRDWIRIGRSLAADVRLDDPTISRRHALIVRGPDGARLLDDRSLNGVFVNGERVEWRTLADGDEIVVGRYRLHFLLVSESEIRLPDTPGVEAAG
jgi:pSer/pThr/pTyr-binding forkhead associated (FHA) protein